VIVERCDPRWRTPGVGSEDSSLVLGLTRYGSVSGLRKDLAMRILDIEQQGDAWLNWRKTGVGASESPSVLGIGYKSRDDLLEEKVTGISANGENEHTRRGKKYEPEARAAYESVYSWPMRPVCVVHDDLPFIKASLDGLREDRQLVLEIKVPTKANYEKVLADGIPDYWTAQIQHQLLVTRAPLAHLVVYRPKGRADRARYKVLPVEADPETQALLLDALVTFWSEVQEEVARRRVLTAGH
jgi:putative phage-type endonuclease